MVLQCRPRTIAHAYLLLLGVLFFLWPVSAGIPGLGLRLAWISITLVLCIVSGLAFSRSLQGLENIHITMPRGALLGLLLFCVLLAWYGFAIPPLAFSDEATIPLPSLTLVGKATRLLTWPGLLASAAVTLIVGILALQRFSQGVIIAMLCAMALGALFLALILPQSLSMVRYPPLVHLMQSLGTLLTGGSLSLLRMQNVLWTLLLGIALWQWRAWPSAARIAAFFAMMLGPLGWTYRLALYQACGELTLGVTSVLLLTTIIREPKHERACGGMLGAVSALWCLERPTALAAIVSAWTLLLVLRRLKACGWTVGVSAPVIAAWLLLAPLFTASYGLESSAFADLAREGFLTPLLVALRSLPMNFHPLGLVVLIGAPALVLFLGRRQERRMLAIAWVLVAPAAAMQHMVAGEVFYGVGRYNVLLLLPLGLGVASLVAIGVRTSRGVIRYAGLSAAIACLMLLLWITPFDFVRYTQELRASSMDIYRAPTEGYLALPIVDVARRYSAEENLVVLSPQYIFLDLFVASGELTLHKRDAIIRRSQAWTESSPDRPVLVQAPVATTYRPNLTKAQEDRLRAARVWALLQPEHRTEKLGMEETVVVP